MGLRISEVLGVPTERQRETDTYIYMITYINKYYTHIYICM